MYLCKILFSRRTQADFQHLENCKPAPFSGTWGGNPFKYAPTVTTMKTVKHPHLSPTCSPRTALPRSRPRPAPAGSSRPVPATSAPTLDPEQLLKVLGAGHVIARGPKSAAALAENGLTPEWTPPGETSAEMATWLRPQVGPGDTVSLQLYGEPLPGLTATLAATGARVVEVAPYRWALPADPARREAAEGVVRSIATAGVQAIVVTSAVQATKLFSVARALGVEDDLRRSLTERIFTATVGEVSKAALEREGVPPAGGGEAMPFDCHMGHFLQLAGTGWHCQHAVCPLDAPQVPTHALRPQSWSGSFRAREGDTRRGSSFAFGKWGGHGASPRPPASSRRARSSRESSRPA